MNIFEYFGISWVSHSNLELFRNDPGMWALRYIHKISDPPGAAAMRGLAAEHGCQIMHNGGEFDDPTEEALKEFNKRTALGVDGAAREKEAGHIPGMIEQYRLLWNGDLPKLDCYQRKIEIEIPGIPVPAIGYTDFELEDTIIDLKTTTRLPSTISPAHRRQGSIYQRASDNRKVDFIYVTPKKAARYTLEDSEQDWLEVCKTAERLKNFLELCQSKEVLTKVVVPNYDTFYWSNPQTRLAARDIFGY